MNHDSENNIFVKLQYKDRVYKGTQQHCFHFAYICLVALFCRRPHMVEFILYLSVGVVYQQL